jgi:hypothetical protein
VSPKNNDVIENEVALCEQCMSIIEGKEAGNHWQCLAGSIWNTEPSVLALSYRILYGLKENEWANELLTSVDFEQCPVSPCFFYHVKTEIAIELHMDDFHGCGPQLSVVKFLEWLGSVMMIKHSGPMTIGARYCHLKRTRILTEEGTYIQASSKHAEDMIKLLHLEDAKTVSTPMVESAGEEASDQLLDAEPASVYRTCVGIAIYLSTDRHDIQFAVKELTQIMKNPTEGSMHMLKRLVKYLKGIIEVWILLSRQGAVGSIMATSDSNWAGCKRTRKSTSCDSKWLMTHRRSAQTVTPPAIPALHPPAQVRLHADPPPP